MDNETKKRLDKLKKELVRQQNSNNRVEGRASQDRAKKLLGIPDSKLGKDSDEEFWNSGNLRLEVKSGKQVSNTFSLFEKAETQSWDYEVSKDNPKELFSLMAMPNGTRDGLFICRLSQIEEIVNELKAIWTKEKDNGLDKE